VPVAEGVRVLVPVGAGPEAVLVAFALGALLRAAFLAAFCVRSYASLVTLFTRRISAHFFVCSSPYFSSEVRHSAAPMFCGSGIHTAGTGVGVGSVHPNSLLRMPSPVELLHSRASTGTNAIAAISSKIFIIFIIEIPPVKRPKP
jgi:hypothetical protein